MASPQYLDEDNLKQLWAYILKKSLPKPTAADAGKIVVSDGISGYKLVSLKSIFDGLTTGSSSSTRYYLRIVTDENKNLKSIYWTT